MNIAEKMNREYKNDMSRKMNRSVLDGVKNRFGFMPEDLEESIFRIGKRLGKIVPRTFDNFGKMFPQMEFSEDQMVINVVDKADKKSGLPIAYVYVPAFEQKLQQEQEARRLDAEKKQREADAAKLERNADRICNYFRLQNGYEEPALRDFIMTALPVEVPFRTFFDGSRVRVQNLIKFNGAVLHGDIAKDVFAVEYDLRGEKVITFFIVSLDPVEMFAKKVMAKEPAFSFFEAMTVSEAITHDDYVGVKVFTDATAYASEVAWRLRARSGDVVQNLLTHSDVVVVNVHVKDDNGDFVEKPVVAIDDEERYAIFGRGQLYCYAPATDTEAGDALVVAK